MALDIRGYDFAQFDTSRAPKEEVDKVFSAIANFIKTKTKDELFSEAISKKILCFPDNTVEDLVASPQFEERNFWVDVEHPKLGDSIKYPGLPEKMSGVEYRVQRCAPQLGEHNKEIYEDMLGFSAEEIALLKSQQVI